MAFDFKGLLSSLAQGDDEAVAGNVLARRKNGPPAIDLTPAQTALHELAQGAMQPQVAEQPVSQAAMNTPVSYDTKGNVIQNAATVQGVQDEPANVADNMTVQARPRMVPGIPLTADMGNGQPPLSQLDDAAQGAQNQYVNAINAPVVKQSLWKDIGAKLIGASNAFVKGYRGDPNIEPSEGWGAIKHNNAIRSAAEKLAPLQQQQGVNRQAALQNANIDIAKIRPEVMQADAMTRALKQQADEEYKGNVIKLGVDKANNIKEYRDQIIDLKTRGADQNDERIKTLNRRIDETIRNNQATEAGRNNRAGASQTGAMARTRLAGQIKQGLAEYNAAEHAKNAEAMVAAREKLARLKAQHFQDQTPDETPEQQ